MRHVTQSAVIFLMMSLIGMSTLVHPASGQSSRIDELKSQMETRSSDIADIESEIRALEEELAAIAAEKRTLESTVRSLELARQRLSAEINLKQQKIDAIDLSIERLELEVDEKERLIAQNREAIAQSLRKIQENDDQTMVEAILSHETLAEYWSDADTLEQFQVSLKNDVHKLSMLKKEVEEHKLEVIDSKDEVLSLQRELIDERALITESKQEQSNLLSVTESKESEFQRLIDERERQKEQFERELFVIESQLQIEIDPSRIPEARAGILAWPLEEIKITQYFGRTVAAQRLYASGSHNGVDFGTPHGSRIRAALSGTVEAMGNTDDQRGCYSYGRWVLIRHNNGLSTMYAHLSKTAVTIGDEVETGQVIAYSGGTPGTPGAGYSTGPHLHFTVFATQGVRVQRYDTSIYCKEVEIPIADSRAYLDPMPYLVGAM